MPEHFLLRKGEIERIEEVLILSVLHKQHYACRLYHWRKQAKQGRNTDDERHKSSLLFASGFFIANVL